MPGWGKWEKFQRPKQSSQQQGTAAEHPVPSQKEGKEEKKEKPVVFNSFEDLASVKIDETEEPKVPQRKPEQKRQKQNSEHQPRNKQPRNFRNRDKKSDQRRRKMTEEKIDTSQYEVEDFKSWLKENKNKDFDEIKANNPSAFASLYEEWEKSKNNSNNNSGQNNEGDNNKDRNEGNKGYVLVGENKVTDEPHQEENSDLKSKKRESWKAWCEDPDKHNGATYTYDEDQEATGLKFDVYKDAEKKEKLATIEYTSPNAVSIDNDNGKVPDVEFFDQLVKDAQKSGHSGIAFNGEMSDEFKTKLALACVANNMPMTGFEEQINVKNLPDKEASLSGDIKKKIEYHNKYIDAKNKVEQHKNDPEKKDQPYKLAEGMTPEDAAIFYAACTNINVKVEGVEYICKNIEGLIYTSDFEYMPKDVKDSISKHNKEIHSKMIERTKNKQRVAEPIVAEDSHPKINRILRKQEFFKQEPLVKKREKFSIKSQRFENFVLSGLNQKQ